MKIAILTTGDTDHIKGLFSNVQNRILHIQDIPGVEVDVYMVRYYDSWLLKLIRQSNLIKQLRKKHTIKEDVSCIRGVCYKNLWVKRKAIDLFFKFIGFKGLSSKKQLKMHISYFYQYDILSTHTLSDMYIADIAKQKYGIPYVTTWHGSDINVYPNSSKKSFDTVKQIIENADWNFFVSKKLQKTSDSIVKSLNKDHLYTGPSDTFFKKQYNKRESRDQLQINTKYHIGFIGNIIPIKNVFSLVEIFDKLQHNLENEITFSIIGDGGLLEELKLKFKSKNIENVRFMGNLHPDKMPNIISSLDVLVLPSLNEGMPRVTLEALVLGVNVVGSDVGGIPEAIGAENSFKLDGDFAQNVSDRITDILKHNIRPRTLDKEFYWEYAVNKEMSKYKEIISMYNKI